MADIYDQNYQRSNAEFSTVFGRADDPALRAIHDGRGLFRPQRGLSRFPYRLGAFFVIGFFVFKALSLALVSPATYNERLAEMESGTVIEWAGAKVMALDPVTLKLAAVLRPLVRH